MFKVVPDQLRISEGWVRCGNCAEIFDASSNLQQSDAENQWIQPLGAPLPDLPAEPLAPASMPEWMLDRVEATYHPSHLDQVRLLGLAQDISEPIVREPETGLALQSEPQGIEPQKTVDASSAQYAPNSSPVLDFEPALPAGAVGYSFAHEPTSHALVSRSVLLGLWAAAVLLLAALFVQVILHGRDRMAATWPETKPLLQAMCARMGCSVQALRKIEAIVIDSSTLSASQGQDAYRLTMVFKNQAKLDLAMPAIEFVLTDTDEQVVFRRVLTSGELGAASRVLFAGREWTTSVDFRVIDTLNKNRIVGYRLLAFYP